MTKLTCDLQQSEILSVLRTLDSSSSEDFKTDGLRAIFIQADLRLATKYTLFLHQIPNPSNLPRSDDSKTKRLEYSLVTS
jgi:hypothetical protein